MKYKIDDLIKVKETILGVNLYTKFNSLFEFVAFARPGDILIIVDINNQDEGWVEAYHNQFGVVIIETKGIEPATAP
jgi:hypothetical protein